VLRLLQPPEQTEADAISVERNLSTDQTDWWR
jgi:hypothetical protein